MSCAAHRDLTARPVAERVLVVDDHPGFRHVARALLADEGFDVVGEAEDGAAALALDDDLEPDLVLLDVQLPDVDGFEVATRLLERRPGLAVVLVSVRDRLDYGPLVERSGARGFLPKTDISRTALARLIGSTERRLVTRSAARRRGGNGRRAGSGAA